MSMHACVFYINFPRRNLSEVSGVPRMPLDVLLTSFPNTFENKSTGVGVLCLWALRRHRAISQRLSHQHRALFGATEHGHTPSSPSVFASVPRSSGNLRILGRGLKAANAPKSKRLAASAGVPSVDTRSTQRAICSAAAWCQMAAINALDAGLGLHPEIKPNLDVSLST